MKILALDTSTSVASLALRDGDAVPGEAALAVGRKRGEHLPGAIAWLLATLGLKASDLEGFAVGLGPGSFTGLRSGLALAKGMALPAGLPLVGVSSLHALAAAAVGHQGLVVPVIDAHKGEVYAAVFRAVDGGLPRRLTPDYALLPGRLPDLIAAAGDDGPVLLIGDGLNKHRDALAAALVARTSSPCLPTVANGASGPCLQFAPELAWRPRAAWVAALAAPRLCAGESDPLDPLVPIYVRSSDTDLSLGPRS